MSQPKYEQVREQLLMRISSGKLAPNEKLKNEAQLAEEFGVSAITVRKALSLLVESGHIRRARGSGSFVSAAPRPAAESSRLVAMMLTQESYPALSLTRIISGIQRTLTQRGYSLLIDWNSTNPKISREGIERMLGQQVEGFLIYPFDPACNREELDLILSNGLPYVLIDRHDYEKPSLYVGSNNYDGGILATRTLIGMGHRKICFCGNLFFLSSEQERFAGFCHAMRQAGLPCGDQALMEHADYDAIVSRVRRGELTALFCCSDRLAGAAIRELLGRGLRVPEDLSVFGFDDNIYSPDNPVPLSTIRQDFDLIGQRAAELLLWRLAHPDELAPLHLLTDVQVVLRGSARAL